MNRKIKCGNNVSAKLDYNVQGIVTAICERFGRPLGREKDRSFVSFIAVPQGTLAQITATCPESMIS